MNILSGDLGLGVPFNWYQYKVLQCIVAHCTGYLPGKFIHTIGNLHYYDRHEALLLQQIDLPHYPSPVINFNFKDQNFFNISYKDIEVKNYVHGPNIKLEVAI